MLIKILPSLQRRDYLVSGLEKIPPQQAVLCCHRSPCPLTNNGLIGR